MAAATWPVSSRLSTSVTTTGAGARRSRTARPRRRGSPASCRWRAPVRASAAVQAALGVPSRQPGVAQGGRGDQQRRATGAATVQREGLGRVEPVAVQADIDLAALAPVSASQSTKSRRTRAGPAARAGARSMACQAFERHQRAAVDARERARLDAGAVAGLQLVRLVLEPGHQRAGAAGAPAPASAPAARPARSAASIRPGSSGRMSHSWPKPWSSPGARAQHLLAHQARRNSSAGSPGTGGRRPAASASWARAARLRPRCAAGGRSARLRRRRRRPAGR